MHRQEFFYPIFLLVSSAVTYLAGLWIERNRKQEKTYIRENAGQFASRQEKKEFKQKGEKTSKKSYGVSTSDLTCCSWSI